MDKKIVAFCCENSALKAADCVGDASVLQAVELVRLPCTGKVEIGLLLQCLEEGHPGVLVLGCPVDNCKYLIGSTRARKRVGMTREILKEAGLNEERVRMDYLSSVDTYKFERIVREMQARLVAAATPAAPGPGSAPVPGVPTAAGAEHAPTAGQSKAPAKAAAKGGQR
jgi:F420-non-reducing hydrogenase iron-sulfur subunit